MKKNIPARSVPSKSKPTPTTLELVTAKKADRAADRRMAKGLKAEEAAVQKKAVPHLTDGSQPKGIAKPVDDAPREFVIAAGEPMKEVPIEPTPAPKVELPDNVNAFLGAAALEVAKAETPKDAVGRGEVQALLPKDVPAGCCHVCGKKLVKAHVLLSTGQPAHGACAKWGPPKSVLAKLSAGAGK